MSDQRLSQDLGQIENRLMRDDEMSMPRLELSDFIGRIGNMVGPTAVSYLTEIWLDELACLDYLPSPTSSDWRFVSRAASARLAIRLLDI